MEVKLFGSHPRSSWLHQRAWTEGIDVHDNLASLAKLGKYQCFRCRARKRNGEIKFKWTGSWEANSPWQILLLPMFFLLHLPPPSTRVPSALMSSYLTCMLPSSTLMSAIMGTDPRRRDIQKVNNMWLIFFRIEMSSSRRREPISSNQFHTEKKL